MWPILKLIKLYNGSVPPSLHYILNKTKILRYHSSFFNLNNAGETDPNKIKLLETIPNEAESSIKMLGVLIDQKLNFADHINHINR